MSNLANFREAREWLSEWEGYRSPAAALRTIKRAAEEQRANYESCVRDGRWPSSFKPDEYRRSVEAIEAAIPRAEERAAKHEKVRAEREEYERAESERERARLLKKYGVRL